jgi:5-methylcytosine-specific restriction endonuclease McrA
MAKKNKEEYNAYMAEYMLKRYHAKRAEIIARLGGACVQCGSTTDLETDHKEPGQKAFNIAKLWNLSAVKLNPELEKCQLLCWSCHVRKTVAERGFTMAEGTHGTLSSFRLCKCSECREAKAAYMRNYRRK